MRWFAGVPCVAGAFAMAGCGQVSAPDSGSQNPEPPTSASSPTPGDGDLVMHVVTRVAALAPACDKAFSQMQKQLPGGASGAVLISAKKAYQVCWNGTGGFEDIAPPAALSHDVQDQLGLAIDQCSNAMSDRVGAAEGLVAAKGDVHGLGEDGLAYFKSMHEHSNQCVQGMAQAGAMVGLSHKQIADALSFDR